ncbi:MAG TPA: hypothetical protein VLX44_09120 [Xanthobacteraceae bacterium]|nr:hypothetical protein [Xanthobacteraceae bacterium]
MACAASTSERATGQDFLQLGLSCMVGRSAPVDLVSAHKWFNVAALLGNSEASRLRREVAAEMSKADITVAQRAARDWITMH